MLGRVGSAAAVGPGCVRVLGDGVRLRRFALLGELAGFKLSGSLFALLLLAELLLFLAGVFGDAVGVGGAAGGADALLFRLFGGALGAAFWRLTSSSAS